MSPKYFSLIIVIVAGLFLMFAWPEWNNKDIAGAILLVAGIILFLKALKEGRRAPDKPNVM